MGTAIWIVVGLISLIVISPVIGHVASGLARLLKAIAFALLLGIPLSFLMLPEGAGQGSFMLIIVLGLAVLFFSGLSSPEPKVARLPPPSPAPVQKIKTSRPRGGGSWFSRWRRPNQEDRISSAWEAIAGEAHEHPNRVNVARKSCERARIAAKARTHDPDALSLLVLLEKRVPEMIETRLKKLASSEGRSAVLLIDETLELLERVAAHCERHLSREGRAKDDHDAVLTSHIEAQLRPDPLSPLH